MSIEENEQKLLSLLSPNATTTIRQIAQSLYVSEPTARRYVNTLAERGMVIRTHGGCMPSSLALDGNTPMPVRFSTGREEKRRIAERAAAMIEPSSLIFLDSSSTVFQMVEFLKPTQNLTVVTSGLKTAVALSEMNIRTVSLGGFIHAANLSANSAYAIQAIEQFYGDLFFFSCDALSDEGEMSDNSYEECLLRRAFMHRAKRCVLLADPSKRGKTCCYRLGSLADVDCCISTEDGETIVLQ